MTTLGRRDKRHATPQIHLAKTLRPQALPAITCLKKIPDSFFTKAEWVCPFGVDCTL